MQQKEERMHIEAYRTAVEYIIDVYTERGSVTYHCKTKKEQRKWLKIIKRKAISRG
jgi:hypothetical protein